MISSIIKKRYDCINGAYTGWFIDDKGNAIRNGTKIKLSKDDVERVEDFARNVSAAKFKEGTLDYKGMYKRRRTGTMIERAVEKLIGKEFIDWTIGPSENYKIPDLRPMGMEIGVKGSEYGNHPMINYPVENPEIIGILAQDKPVVSILGVFDIDVLKNYSTKLLINTAEAVDKNTKTAFYGLQHGLYFDSVDDLRRL